MDVSINVIYAKVLYMSKMDKTHDNLQVSRSGLVIDPGFPFFGASPDGIIQCTCCRMGVLEIKCPFTCKDKSFLQASTESTTFCLGTVDDELALDINHAYYYQVQAQIKFCSANYCDFVVWSDKEVFIERIYLDDDFISDAIEKATLFIKVGVMPEIVGKWYSKTPVHTSTNPVATLTETVSEESGDTEKILWCYCKGEEDGEMIACDHENCPIVWFHTICLKITIIPKKKWYCPDCRKM